MRTKHRNFIYCSRAAAILGAWLLATLTIAADPAWWAERGVTNGNQANDYAAVNQGQVKNMAVAAIAELNAHLPGGAGDYLNYTVLPSLTGTSVSTNDYAAVNLGQLKNVAKPFYDRLIAIGYCAAYPWTNPQTPPNDYAMANIGQVKNLFSFDLGGDSNTNGLPDQWELDHFGFMGIDPNADSDGDGLTNLQEYQQGKNPRDYYNGQSPVITKVDGDQQHCLPDRFTRYPLRVLVCNAQNVPLVNAPVEFKITGGTGRVALARHGVVAAKVVAHTDGDGYAGAYVKVHTNKTAANVAQAAAPGYAAPGVDFSAVTDYNLPPAAPTNMMATPGGVGLINVTWQDNSSDEVNFVIERSVDQVNWEVVGTVDADVTSLTDHPAGQGVFFYRVTSTYGYE